MTEAGAPAGGWRGALRPFLTGVTFLTRVPGPAWVGHDPEHLARSTVWFPLIGALVGTWGGAFYLIGRTGWAAPVVAVLLSTAATVWLTGAFHEDALADACDGFGGGWAKDDVLRIMKDSRVGSYGVVGLVLVMALKVAALSALSPGDALRALVAAHALGRWSSLPLLWRYGYARESPGTGGPFAGSVTAARLLAGTALAAGIAAPVLGRAVLPAAAAVLGVTWMAGRYFQGRIGGITGDCLGAAGQVAELSVYLVLAFDPRMIPLA